MSVQIAKIIKAASEDRKGWLRTIAEQPGGLLSVMHVPVGQGGALAPMERAGLIERHKRHFYKLTPLGEEVRLALQSPSAKVEGGREQIAQIVARAYGGSLHPGLGVPGDYPIADVDYRAADAICALHDGASA